VRDASLIFRLIRASIMACNVLTETSLYASLFMTGNV